MNGPKVNQKLALVKLGYLLESLRIPRYSPYKGSENVMGADNQQERLKTVGWIKEPSRFLESSETIRQAPVLQAKI